MNYTFKEQKKKQVEIAEKKISQQSINIFSFQSLNRDSKVFPCGNLVTDINKQNLLLRIETIRKFRALSNFVSFLCCLKACKSLKYVVARYFFFIVVEEDSFFSLFVKIRKMLYVHNL